MLTLVSGGGHNRGEDDKLLQVGQVFRHLVQVESSICLGNDGRIPALSRLHATPIPWLADG